MTIDLNKLAQILRYDLDLEEDSDAPQTAWVIQTSEGNICLHSQVTMVTSLINDL